MVHRLPNSRNDRLWPIATDDALTAQPSLSGIADMDRFSSRNDLQRMTPSCRRALLIYGMVWPAACLFASITAGRVRKAANAQLSGSPCLAQPVNIALGILRRSFQFRPDLDTHLRRAQRRRHGLDTLYGVDEKAAAAASDGRGRRGLSRRAQLHCATCSRVRARLFKVEYP